MHVSWGEIEHMVPISQDASLVVDWSNLTLVCSICNGTKRDFWEEGNEVLNPYVDDPDDHLVFGGSLVLQLTQRGETTIVRVGLNRPALIERRQERLDQVEVLIRAFEAMPEGSERDVVAMAIHAEAARRTEYSATVKAYLEQRLPQP
jgi:hypothetical protein